MRIPKELVNAFKQGEAAVFVGAGASASAKLEDWQGLVKILANDLKIKPNINNRVFSHQQLLQIPQYYVNRKGDQALYKVLRGLYDVEFKPCKSYEYISQLPTNLFYTTNFDTLLEKHVEKEVAEPDLVVDNETAIQFSENRKDKYQVRKVHGTIKDQGTLVVTRHHYAQFPFSRPKILQDLKSDLESYVFLFVGYSLADPDFNNIYNNVLNTMKDMRKQHFLTAFSPDQFEIEDLSKRGFTIIDLNKWSGATATAKLESFLSELAEITSEIMHVRRFFRGINRGETIPILITSQLHEGEKYVLYPACDIHAANQIGKALSKIGCTYEIVPDYKALKKKEKI